MFIRSLPGASNLAEGLRHYEDGQPNNASNEGSVDTDILQIFSDLKLKLIH